MIRSMGISSGIHLSGDLYSDGWENRFEDNLIAIRNDGFDCIDYQHFVNTETPLFDYRPKEFEEKLQKEKALAELCGLRIWQTHAPWRYPPRDLTPGDRAERIEKMCRSIEGTGILGAKYMAVHPLMPYGFAKAENQALFDEINLDFFHRLEEKGKECGVTVCLENLPGPDFSLTTVEQVIAFADQIHSPWLRLCLDTGHANVFGMGIGDAVRLMGKDRMMILHIHDNDGVRDWHYTPGYGTVDWEDFHTALDEIGFAGCVNLETTARSLPKGTPLPDDPEVRLLAFTKKLANRK